jgi:hypothetical protein
MAFFYPPPPPSQSASYAPPVPHEPQGSTGDQPPRRQVQTVLAMALVLASWPADLEPRLQAPNNQQVKNAAVIPPPPFVPPQIPYVPQFHPIIGQWTVDWAAQTIHGNAAVIPPPPIVQPPVPYDTPLTHVYGQWLPAWPAQRAFGTAAVLPPPPAANPPFARQPASILTAWHDPVDIELIATWTIAPDNPDPPPIAGPITATELSIVQRAWPTDWPAQTTRHLVPPPAGLPPVPVQPAPSRTAIYASWPASLEPRLQTPNDRENKIAPLMCQPVGLPAHDAFEINYSTSLGPCNWTPTAGQLGTDGLGHAYGIAAGSNLSFWKETAFGPDQYAQIQVIAYGNDTPAAVVRISASGLASYAMVANPSASEVDLFQTVAGVGTLIQAATGVTLTDGDVLRLEVIGSRLRMFVNGVQIGTDQTDTAVTTGQPGIFVNHIGPTAALLDNFLADQFTGQFPTRPTGWLNPGIWAAAFPDLDIRVVDINVVLPADAPDAPRPQGPYSPQEWTIRQAWSSDWPEPQRLVQLAPPTPSSPPVPSGPLSATEISELVRAWPTEWTEPQRLTTVVPPSAGSPPTPHGPLSVTTLAGLTSQWVQTWPAQRARNMTASLPSGTNPPPVRSISNANLGALINQWQPNWPAQSVKPVRTIDGAPPSPFKAEWAVNSNQIVGPWAPQPETH